MIINIIINMNMIINAIINMNINIKAMKGMSNIKNSSWIEQTKFNSYTLPTFTKKIFSSLGKYL